MRYYFDRVLFRVNWHFIGTELAICCPEILGADCRLKIKVRETGEQRVFRSIFNAQDPITFFRQSFLNDSSITFAL